MFHPSRCPYRRCLFHAAPVSRFFIRKGVYRPRCRSHPVPRFRCRACGRTFSRQSFRADYRQKKPYLNARCLDLLVKCVGQRQAAHSLGVARRTVERRFVWLARHATAFHQNHLAGAHLHGPFQLDELESFEANRYQPVTVPVLIDRATFFLIGTAVAPLRRKGRMTSLQKRRRAEHEARHGRRPSRSDQAVHRVLTRLRRVTSHHHRVILESDEKPSYGHLARRLFGSTLEWGTHTSAARRDCTNPLFPINHTNARLRHFLARLRRRTWCVSKKRAALRRHLDIATLWINYCRGMTVRTRITPAQALGLAQRLYRLEEVLAWRQDWGARSPKITP